MHAFQIAYNRLENWSHTDLAYLQHDPALTPFYTFPVHPSSFSSLLESRKKFSVDRHLWLATVKAQYRKLGFAMPVDDQVFLSEKTFTVTTAHQPVLFTGPLYHIYKIASTIHLARSIEHTFPDHRILPVFVLGSEDHDWAELNHFHLFGKKVEWERSVSGPGGRISLDGLNTLIETVDQKLGNTAHGKEVVEILYTSLQRASNYGEFHQALLLALFQEHGLIVINLDDPECKRAFVPLMEKEIREHFSYQYVTPTQKELEHAGFKPQAFCRLLNLFYLSVDRRERLDVADGNIIRVDSGITASLENTIEDLHQHPERFSPNVVMRPLYQELILPNLAYIGGGGEIAYWLERKSQFEAAGVHFPMLVRRNSLMMIDSNTANQIEKADLTWEDLLHEYDVIVKSFLTRHSQTNLNFEEESALLSKAYAQLAAKAEKLDPTLATAILAEQHKQIKQFEQLGSRLLRTEKQLQETHLKRIQKIKERLFPEGGLQERYENFLPYYAVYGARWIDAMVEICDPLEEKFTVVQLQEV